MSLVDDSPQWHRVRHLKPRLRSHVDVRRHIYRGRCWYVLDDRSAGRTHRLDENAWQIVGRMDGTATLERLLADCRNDDGDGPTQDDTIRVLGTLHGADLIQCDLPPDTRELLDRRSERRATERLGRLRSPFVLKLPLLDPERILQRMTGPVHALFSRVGLLLFAAWVLAAGVLAAMHWPALADATATRLSSPSSLAVLVLLYPIVKALHELGHALAVRAWGGEVHDTGVMLLVFMPVPYVDATAANAFEDKWARIAVAGAGIAVELGLAALGAFVWLAVEPGVVRNVALDLMIIGGVSTLLFNGNPLLRFDGYYVLADLIEIPNLASRSAAYYGYLIRRYLLGQTDTPSPVGAVGERRWFVAYGAAAFAYKAFILVTILLFVLKVSLVLGIVLGAWAVIGQVVVPTWQRLRRLARDTAAAGQRLRAVAVAAGIVLAAVALVSVPVPQRSLVEGVVWLPEQAQARAGTDCFVDALLADHGAQVAIGTPLVQCRDPLIQARLALAEARLAELEFKRLGERQAARAKALMADDAIAVVREEVRVMRERVDRLVVRSPAAGTLVVPADRDLPGRHLSQGDLVAYVLADDGIDVRVAVSQADIGLVRSRIDAAEVRLAHRPADVFEASVVRELPGATRTLPSAALGTAGGGNFAVSPDDADGRTAVHPVFQLQLRLARASGIELAGVRAHVRLDHGRSPLAAQAFRAARQLLLRRLGV